MKNVVSYFCAILFIALLIQCKSNNINPDKIILLSNLEKCTINENTLTDEISAHSGKYCSKIDSVNFYSFGLCNYLKYMSNDQIKKIKVRIWVFMPSLTEEVFLVTEISSNGNMRLYQSKSIGKFVNKINKWTEITNDLDIPDNISNENILKVYLWSANKKTAYMDDLSISFE
jgi:hypothetical protein